MAIDIVLWGFITRYLNSVSGSGMNFVPTSLGGVLLWDFCTRIMQGVTTAFLEDVWSRNFLNLFASPLSISEYITGLVITSVVTSSIGVVVMMLLATGVFHLQFLSMGLPLIGFLMVLFVFGISLGIFASAIVLRLGPASEWLLWPIPALLSPFAAVFYTARGAAAVDAMGVACAAARLCVRGHARAARRPAVSARPAVVGGSLVAAVDRLRRGVFLRRSLSACRAYRTIGTLQRGERCLIMRSLGRQFGWLWAAFAVSTFGTCLAFEAYSMIAILVLHSGPTAVSVLASAGRAVGAVLAVSLGPWVEFHRKRPVMIAMDLVRFAAVISVPAAFALGRLSFTQLLIVSVIGAAADIAFRAASGAYLKALVRPEDLLVANGRFAIHDLDRQLLPGPPLGGAAMSVFGPVTTVVADAASYLLSAIGIGVIRGEEPPPRREPMLRGFEPATCSKGGGTS